MKARPRLERVLVVERDGFEGLADRLGQRGVHGRLLAGGLRADGATRASGRAQGLSVESSARGKSFLSFARTSAILASNDLARTWPAARNEMRRKQAGMPGEDPPRPRPTSRGERADGRTAPSSTATTSRSSRELQRDARLSNAELASRIGLSAAPTWRRVKWLEQQGYITGYRAELDRRKHRPGRARLRARRRRAQHRRRRRARSRTRSARLPEVIACHYISGAGTFELQVMATDLDAFSRFVARHAAQPAAT